MPMISHCADCGHHIDVCRCGKNGWSYSKVSLRSTNISKPELYVDSAMTLGGKVGGSEMLYYVKEHAPGRYMVVVSLKHDGVWTGAHGTYHHHYKTGLVLSRKEDAEETGRLACDAWVEKLGRLPYTGVDGGGK